MALLQSHRGVCDSQRGGNIAQNMIASLPDDDVTDADEPPDDRTPRSASTTRHRSSSAFSKTAPRCSHLPSLLTGALHSSTAPEEPVAPAPKRVLPPLSIWKTHSAGSAAELTSDGSSAGTRTASPSPPPPSTTFPELSMLHKMLPRSVSIVEHDGAVEHTPQSPEHTVEANLGRKRCIKFACGGKEQPKPEKQAPPEPPKRACSIQFACPARAPEAKDKTRFTRPASPAPCTLRLSSNPHRDSESTMRGSPSSGCKPRLVQPSLQLDLAKSEAYRFHEFASAEEEVDEWVQESTCHRNRLTVSDTLQVENHLRRLGLEAEEEAMEEQDDADADDADDADNDIADDLSDDGFHTDDEDGFAESDDDSDGDSTYQWWTPGNATSEHIRPSASRSLSESSIASDSASESPYQARRMRSRPVKIRAPSAELPDSTDFVCGTLDEDHPLEAAYLSCLEQRRAAKRVGIPQDIDPSFPTEDPDLDDEDDEESEHFMHGPMDPHDETRGRRKDSKRSPAVSPKRLRSPPPKKLFGQSPRRLRSPAPPARLRSPPPTRRGSALVSPQRDDHLVHFAGLAERPPPTTTASLPRTPISAMPPDLSEDDETCGELPPRRAIDIKIGLETKRLRRKEKLWQRQQRKACHKDKRPLPGKGCERMREVGLELAAHRGSVAPLGFGVAGMQPTPDQKDMHILSM